LESKMGNCNNALLEAVVVASYAQTALNYWVTLTASNHQQ